jgi:hypothetical protein
MSPFPYRASRQGSSPIKVSFEFFPPKTAEMETTLWSSIERLAPLSPQFVSVTYGAGGSTRERTHATVSRLVRETRLKPAAHLTCVAATRDEVNEVVRSYRDAAIPSVGSAPRTIPIRAGTTRPATSSPASGPSAISRSLSRPTLRNTRKPRRSMPISTP